MQVIPRAMVRGGLFSRPRKRLQAGRWGRSAGGRKAEGPQSLRANRRTVYGYGYGYGFGYGFGRSERWAAQAHAFKAPVGFGSNAGAALWLPRE